MKTISKRSKVYAINTLTGDYRQDLGSPSKPRIYTVESIETGLVKLFQVGTYEVPLRFSLDTGLPYLDEHSKTSNLFKTWKNWRIESLDAFS